MASKSVRDTFDQSNLKTSINDQFKGIAGLRHGKGFDFQTQHVNLTDALKEATLGFGLNGEYLGLSRASLGLNNVLYLTLKRLLHTNPAFQKESKTIGIEEAKEITPITWLAIEEPEAHLHPHLQRQVYRALLNSGDSKNKNLFATLVSTHSPHLVSISEPSNILLLKREDDGSTVGCQFDKDGIDPNDVAKLKNYLQVTRAEMVFAAGVILVEGIAERNLIHAWYPALDSLGISVCCIDGVDFDIYVNFLDDLKIPYVVVTDWDPQQDGEKSGNQTKTKNSYLLKHSLTESNSKIFFNPQGCTLEWELIQVEKYSDILKTIAIKRHPNVGERDFQDIIKATTLNFKNKWDKLDIPKGLCSQLLVAKIKDEQLTSSNHIPEYIRKAVNQIASPFDPLWGV